MTQRIQNTLTTKPNFSGTQVALMATSQAAANEWVRLLYKLPRSIERGAAVPNIVADLLVSNCALRKKIRSLEDSLAAYQHSQVFLESQGIAQDAVEQLTAKGRKVGKLQVKLELTGKSRATRLEEQEEASASQDAQERAFGFGVDVGTLLDRLSKLGLTTKSRKRVEAAFASSSRRMSSSSYEKKITGNLVFNAEDIGATWMSRNLHYVYSGVLLVLVVERLFVYLS